MTDSLKAWKYVSLRNGESEGKMSKHSIQVMYDLFGRDEKHKCKECSNLERLREGSSRFKCKVWGYSASSASDFRKKWDACGKFNKEHKDTYHFIEPVKPISCIHSGK